MPIIRGGQYSRLIDIQSIQVNPNGTRGWHNLFSKVPARVNALTAGEAVHQLGPMNVQAILIKIRYRPGIKVQMRVVLRNRILEIVSIINEEEADKELALMCREAPVSM